MVCLWDTAQDSRDHDRHMDGTTTAWGPNGLGVVKLGIPIDPWLLVDGDKARPYRWFTPEDDATILALADAGMKPKAIGRRVNRAEGSIRGRLAKLRRPGPTSSPTGPSAHGDD